MTLKIHVGWRQGTQTIEGGPQRTSWYVGVVHGPRHKKTLTTYRHTQTPKYTHTNTHTYGHSFRRISLHRLYDVVKKKQWDVKPPDAPRRIRHTKTQEMKRHRVRKCQLTLCSTLGFPSFIGGDVVFGEKISILLVWCRFLSIEGYKVTGRHLGPSL